MNIRQVADEEAEVTEESMKKAEKALNSIGVVVRDSPSTFRPMFDIISDLGTRWEDLSQVQQAYVAESLAGKRQANVLISTLQNWDMAEKQLSESINANGSALQENEVYMQSWEAKSKQLSANASEFWTNTLNTDTIKNIIDTLSGLIDVLDFLVNNSFSKFALQVSLTTAVIYGLGRAIKYVTGTAVIGSFLNGLDMAFATLVKVRIGAMTTSAAIKTLTAAILASPLAIIAIGATAIFGIVKAVDSLTTSFEEQQEVIDDLSSKVKELQSEYDNLKSKEDRTKDEEIYLKLLEKELEIKEKLLKTKTKEQMEEVFLEPKIGGSGVKIANWNVDRLATLKESLATAESQVDFDLTEQKISTIEESLAETLKTLLNYKDVIGDLPPELEALADAIEYAFNSDEVQKHVSNVLDSIDFSDKTKEEFSKINQQLTELFKGIDFDNFAWTKEIEDGLRAIGISGADLEKVKKYFDEMGKSAEEAEKKIKGVAVSSEDLADSLKDVTSVATDVSKAMQEYNETGKLSQETITDLVIKYPELIDQLKIENGQLVLNKEAVQGLLDTRINSMIQSLEASKNFTVAEAENTKTRINNLILEAEAIKRRNAAYNVISSAVYPDPSEWMKSVKSSTPPYANKYEEIKAEQAKAKMAEANALQAQLNADSAVDDKIASMKALLGGIKSSAYSGSYPSSKSGSTSGSKSGSTADKTEEPSYTSPVDAIVQEIQAQSNLTKTKAEAIQATIDQAKSDKNYSLALEKTTDLIQNQQQQLEELNTARDRINYYKDDQLKNSQFGDISRWYNDLNEASTVYVYEYNKANAETQKVMESQFGVMQKLRKAWVDNAEAVEELTKSQAELAKSYAEIRKEAYDATIEANTKIADEAISILKKAIETAKDLELKAIEKRMEAEDERHENVIKNLDAEIKALQDLEDANDYAKDLTKSQKEVRDLQNELALWERDNSIEAIAKREELSKQLKEKQESLAEKQHKHDVELRKRDLENQKAIENNKYNNVKNSLEKEKKSREYYWNEVLNNEQYFANLRKDIINGNTAKINSALNEYLTKFKSVNKQTIQEIGASWTALQSQISAIVNTKAELPNVQKPPSNNNPQPKKINVYGVAEDISNAKSYAGTSKFNYITVPMGTNANASSGDIVLGGTAVIPSVGKGTRVAGIDASETLKEFKKYISNFDSGGYTGNFGSEGKLAVLHEKEIVLNKQDSQNLLKAVNLIRDFNIQDLMKNNPLMSIMNNFKMPQFTPVLTSAGNNPVYNLNIKFDNFRGTRQDQQNVSKTIVDSLKRIGHKNF